MALRATEGDEDRVGGIVCFRRSFCASSTERLPGLNSRNPQNRDSV